MVHITLPTGLHRVQADVYHADPSDRPSLSSTLARLILTRSPRHAWTAHPRLNPMHEPVEKKTFDIGRAAHRAALGAGEDYVAYPPEVLGSNGAASTTAAKEWAADQRAAGRTVLKAEECDKIGLIADSVRRKLALLKIEIDPDHSEIAAIGEIDGCPVRMMADYAPPGKPYLLDLKTTEDASPDGCIRAVTNYGYDVQIAHYLSVWEAVTGEKRRMRLVMVEKSPPYECSVVELYAAKGDEADWMDDAYGKIAYARSVWSHGLVTGEWPGYPAQIAVIGAPGYYRDKWSKFGADTSDAPTPDALERARQFQSPEGVNA
jgi:hypothetical protein